MILLSIFISEQDQASTHVYIRHGVDQYQGFKCINAIAYAGSCILQGMITVNAKSLILFLPWTNLECKWLNELIIAYRKGHYAADTSSFLL